MKRFWKRSASAGQADSTHAAETWSRADLHLHTTHSDGLMTPKEVIDIIAERRVLDVVAITDHDTTSGAFVARDYAAARHPHLAVIVGQEVTTGDGDVLGLFLQSTLPRYPTAAAAIAAIHAQNGLAIAAHPFVHNWGIESVGAAITHLAFDAVEVRHGCPLSIPFNVRARFANRRGQQLPEIGSSDSHIPYSAGEAFTWFPGRTPHDLRCAIQSNWVRPGGTTWKPGSLLRKLPVIWKRGWVSYSPDQAHPVARHKERKRTFIPRSQSHVLSEDS